MYPEIASLEQRAAGLTAAMHALLHEAIHLGTRLGEELDALKTLADPVTMPRTPDAETFRFHAVRARDHLQAMGDCWSTQVEHACAPEARLSLDAVVEMLDTIIVAITTAAAQPDE